MPSIKRPGFQLRARRAPRALVLRDLTPEEVDAPIDWSGWYVADRAPSVSAPAEGIPPLLSAIAQLCRERGLADHHIGADLEFAWVREEPLVRVRPAAYLLDHRPPSPLPDIWQTWLSGRRPPRLALEVVSADWRRDYHDKPAKYWQLGCPELVLFDAEVASGHVPMSQRVPLQVYRRDPDGAYMRVHAGADPAWISALDSWLLVLKDAPYPVLRIARAAHTTALIPTEDEARRADAEARAAEARAREAAHHARTSAEARVRELEARVRDLEKKRP